MPWLGRSIFELAITARCVFPYSRRSHLPVRMPCGFFGGFIWDRLPRACLPVPSCLIRIAITRHASRDVIVPIATLIVSPYGFSSPLAPSLDTTSGEGVLAWLAGPFMSARRGMLSCYRFSSRRSSSRLLASSSHAHQSRGASPSVVSDCGRGVGSRAYRLCYQSAHPLRQCSPRSSTR